MKRHKKDVETARCCWVCGKIGGSGFTTTLRWLGYDVAPGEMAYAHPTCVIEVQKRLAAQRRVQPCRHKSYSVRPHPGRNNEPAPWCPVCNDFVEL